MTRARLWAERSWVSDSVNFYFIEYRAEDRFQPYLCTKMEFEKQPEGSECRTAEPTFRLDRSGAQEMFDTLWRAGFRPTDQRDEGPAMKGHLEDMRAIAFAKLKVEPPAP